MQILFKNKTPTEAWEKKVKCCNCKSKFKLVAEDVFRTYYEIPPWYPNGGTKETLYQYECLVCGERNEIKRPPENVRVKDLKKTGLVTEFDPNTGIGYLIENCSYGSTRQIPFLIESTNPEDLNYKTGDVVEFDSASGSRAWGVRLCKVQRYLHVNLTMAGEKAWAFPAGVSNRNP